MSFLIETRLNSKLVLPGNLVALRRLATNFAWAWMPAIRDVLREVDPEKSQRGIHPVQILAESNRLDSLSKDPGFVGRVDAAAKILDDYLSAKPWSHSKLTHDAPVAYFCAEYGLHESFAQYSGGLGILAGDHCKEASDMDLPFVAIGCFYTLGFFRQVLDPSGRQEHLYPQFQSHLCPIEQVTVGGKDLKVTVSLPGRDVIANVWKVAVGRVSLLLLDTNTDENQPEDRLITSQLYTRGREMRLTQEMVLGIGGVKVLSALGIAPSVYHMNEGHSSLLLVQRLVELVRSGASLSDSKRQIKGSSILTIHTPVSAGNERFEAKLVKRLLSPTLESANLSIADVLKQGVGDDGNRSVFDMTAFALRNSRAANGVSLLHGETAHQTWHEAVKLPVSGLTNGVHMPTWLGPEMVQLFEKKGAVLHGETGLKLVKSTGIREDWKGAADASDAELSAAHQAQKQRMMSFVRARILGMEGRFGMSPDDVRRFADQINPDAFTIGFARRFASYKRASLLFSDPKRLRAILENADRPVQVFFAGKAHPADGDGQAIIAEVFALSRDKRFAGKVFLIEDYDMEVGRMLVQGVDLWLNNPRRPLEASGTSGMKAAANGIPNASILDGWWDEAYSANPRNGYAIGERKNQTSIKLQDKFDATSLYNCLENEVLPTYFQNGVKGPSKEWVAIMRNSIASSIHAFSTKRMIDDYVAQMYSL